MKDESQFMPGMYAGMSEYSDDILYPILMRFFINEPLCMHSRLAAKRRRALVRMILQFCLKRDELPSPIGFFKDKSIGNGRYLAVDVEEFVVNVFICLQEINDPNRRFSYDEHRARIEGLRV